MANPQVANAIADQAVAEDASWSYVVPANTFSDADGNTLTYTASLASGVALPSWLSFNASTRTFSGSPPLNFNGNIDLRVTASDGTASINDDFRLTVTPVNDAPVIAGTMPLRFAVNENSANIGSLSASDPDSSSLTFSIAGGPDAALFSINSSTGAISFNSLPDFENPFTNFSNSYNFTARVSDGVSFSERSIIVDVLNSREAIDVLIDSNFLLPISIASPGSITTGWLDWMNAGITRSEAVGISAGNVADIPVGGDLFQRFDTLSPGTYRLSFLARNESNETAVLVYAAQQQGGTSTSLILPLGLGAKIYLQPNAQFVRVNLEFTINSSIGFDVNELYFSNSYNFPEPLIADSVNKPGTVIRVAEVSLSRALGNTAPVVSNLIPDQAVAEDASWSYAVPASTFSDADGNTLTYTASLASGEALPSWLTFNGSTRTFSGTPPLNFNGNIDLRVTASDGTASINDTFRLTVTPVNDAPIFSASSQSVAATGGTARTVSLVATDVDGDALTYTVATPGKGAASISGSTLIYTPTFSASGADSFVVTASDGKGGTATQTIDVIVSASQSGAPAIVSDVKKVGAEFLVNAATSGDQSYPVLAKFSNGGFVVGWIDRSGTLGDGSGSSIKGRLYNSAGEIVSAEFLINSQTTGEQLLNGITTLSNDNVVFTWYDYSGSLGDGNSPSIKAQIFSPSGAKVGVEFLVNTQIGSEQKFPAIGALTDGRFVIAWEDFSQTLGDASGHSIKAQVFDQNGVKIGSEFLVNSQTLNFQWAPAVTGLPNGGFVVTWQDGTSWQAGSGSLGDSSSGGIKAQVFSSAGQKVGVEFLVNSETSGEQAVTGITSFSNGNFVIVWEDASGTLGDNSGRSIKAQIFSAAGAKLGSEFLVNSQTTGDQLNPYVAELPSGAFMIAWEDASGATGDGSGYGIKAQIYSAGGAKIGGEFVLNTNTSSDQYAPTIVALNNGTIVTAWMDSSRTLGDASGLSIKAQLLTIDLANVSMAENSVNVTVVKGSDPNPDATLTYSIAGGEDAGLFQINPATGALSFRSAPDFEAPADRDKNNVYGLTVQVSDGLLIDTQAITVIVTNANDAPTFSVSSQSVAATAGTAKTITLAAADVDGDTLTYTVATPGKGAATISGSTLTYTPTSSASGADSFVVTASDGRGGTATQTINATIAPLADTTAPTVTTFSPTDGATNVTAGSNIVVTFNEAIALGTGTIEIRSGSATGAIVESFNAATSARLTASGGALTIDPTNNLAAGTKYYVVLPSGAIRDTAGNAYAGTSIYDFTTAPPAAASFRLITSDGWSGAVGGTGTVFGTAGYQDVTLLSGSLVFDASFNRGGDVLRYTGPASSYAIARSGSSAQISASTGLSVSVPVGVNGLLNSFDDGVRKLAFASGSFRIGEQAFASTATSIVSAPGSDAIPSGADANARASAILSAGSLAAGQTAGLTIGGRVSIFGSSEADIVAIAPNQKANIVFDASFNRGGDVVILPNQADAYTATRVGSSVLLVGADQSLTIPVGTRGLTLRFADVDRDLLFASGAVKIGDQSIGTVATPLTPSATLTSIDIGTSSVSETVSGAAGKVIFTDDPTKNSFVKIRDFGSDDRIQLKNGTGYDFTTGDFDNDGLADDLAISFSIPETGIINEIHILNAVSPDAFVADQATAIAAVGFNFMTFA